MQPTEVRFWSKTKLVESGCVEWQAGLDKDGYGKFHAFTKTVRAHIFSYSISVGPIPTGNLVLHRCDNRRWVNPAHLFLGTHKDNAQDCRAKERHFKTSESKGKNRTLTPAQVREVLTLCKLGTHTQMEIAVLFGVTQSQISRIKNREQWTFI